MSGKTAPRVRRWLAAWGLAGVIALFCGCRTAGFYAQAVRGQCAILCQGRRAEKILADPKAPEALKARLRLVRGLRDFGQNQLHLPLDGNYERYVDLHRPYVVWNVEAAPEFSLEAKAWWYPFAGRLSYRGYFREAGAREYAQNLGLKGLDVMVGGVTAYSTLGWFKDPLLNTFLFEPEPDLAETLFHELAHRRVFAHGDTDFNEAFATAVGEAGARRWLKAKGDAGAIVAYQAHIERTREFTHLVAVARQRLEALYGDLRGGGGQLKAAKGPRALAPEELRRRKGEILDQLRADYERMKTRRGADDEYDAWFAAPLNNARLNSVATYYDLVPGFERMLAGAGEDLAAFYQAAEALSKLPKADRRQWLEH